MKTKTKTVLTKIGKKSLELTINGIFMCAGFKIGEQITPSTYAAVFGGFGIGLAISDYSINSIKYYTKQKINKPSFKLDFLAPCIMVTGIAGIFHYVQN